jgi:hypothetical protein
MELIPCAGGEIIGWLERESARLRYMASGRHEHCLIRYTIAWSPMSDFTKRPTNFLVWSPPCPSFRQRHSFHLLLSSFAVLCAPSLVSYPASIPDPSQIGSLPFRVWDPTNYLTVAWRLAILSVTSRSPSSFFVVVDSFLRRPLPFSVYKSLIEYV